MMYIICNYRASKPRINIAVCRNCILNDRCDEYQDALLASIMGLPMNKPKKKKRSIRIPTQIRKQCPACDFHFAHIVPYGDESEEKLKEFLLYQILESTFTGTKKERSIAQLGLYWKCCDVVAEHLSDHNNQWQKEDIDFEIKTQVGKKHPWMIKRFKMINGIAHIELISIAFQNLKVLDANKFFDKGFKELADMASMTVDELINLAKSRMK